LDGTDRIKTGPYQPFTDGQRLKILRANSKRNGGVLRSDLSGAMLQWPKGGNAVGLAKLNEAQVDHIVARSNGGTNNYSNACVLSGIENRDKWDK
jgi:hypothetical protein